MNLVCPLWCMGITLACGLFLVLLVLSAFQQDSDDKTLWEDPLLDLPEKATLSDLTDDQEGVDPSVLASYFADFNAYLELDCLEDEDLEDLVQIHSIFAAHRRSNKIKAQYRRVDRQEHVFTLLHVGKFEQRF